jgi:hypothetical protein
MPGKQRLLRSGKVDIRRTVFHAQYVLFPNPYFPRGGWVKVLAMQRGKMLLDERAIYSPRRSQPMVPYCRAVFQDTKPTTSIRQSPQGVCHPNIPIIAVAERNP